MSNSSKKGKIPSYNHPLAPQTPSKKTKKTQKPKQHQNTSLYDLFDQIQISGDGNCFFRPILYGLLRDDSEYDDLRQGICDYMVQNRSDFEEFIIQ